MARLPQAGAMRTPLVYQNPVAGTATASGEVPITWPDVFRLFARVNPLSGNELFRAAQVHAEVTTEVTVWYDARITPKGRFQVGTTRYLYPLSVIPDEANRMMTCLCKERIGEAA